MPSEDKEHGMDTTPSSHPPPPDAESHQPDADTIAKPSRACDTCRRRKIRCDFVQLPSGKLEKCLNCFSRKVDCTFDDEPQPRKRRKKRGEVPPVHEPAAQELEDKIARVERVLQFLCPDSELRERMINEEEEDDPNRSPECSSEHLAFNPSTSDNALEMLVRGVRGLVLHSQVQDRENTLKSETSMDDQIQENSFGIDGIFFGESSDISSVNQVFALKQSRPSSHSTTPQSLSRAPSRNQIRWNEDASTRPDFGARDPPAIHPSFLGHRRPEFWAVRPLERNLFMCSSTNNHVKLTFPDDDLLSTLIDHFFKHVNTEFPLLHRPMFDRIIKEKLHKTHPLSGAIVLLVCSNGARYTDDPRVRVPDAEALEYYTRAGGKVDATGGKLLRGLVDRSKGWKYFEQALSAVSPASSLAPVTVEDIQIDALSSIYLLGSSIPQQTWLGIGVGLRRAQDVGVHRKKPQIGDFAKTAEDEQWKRAFWVLVTLDTVLCAASGRPVALHSEDFDVELPIDCDDEFWETPDPTSRFKQPQGKPSQITAFNLAISLNEILACCLRTIYSIKKSQVCMGVFGQQWRPTAVQEIDSALNRWLSSVPPHLRWDPEQPNETFFAQSASLHSSFYHLQILLHRPFIPSPKRPSTMPFPSLDICANAARNIVRIACKQMDRMRDVSIHTPFHLLSAGVVLLLKVWERERSGESTTSSRERASRKADMDDVDHCLRILQDQENKRFWAGRFWDLLNGLAHAKPKYFGKHSAEGSTDMKMSWGKEKGKGRVWNDRDFFQTDIEALSAHPRFSPSPFAPTTSISSSTLGTAQNNQPLPSYQDRLPELHAPSPFTQAGVEENAAMQFNNPVPSTATVAIEQNQTFMNLPEFEYLTQPLPASINGGDVDDPHHVLHNNAPVPAPLGGMQVDGLADWDPRTLPFGPVGTTNVGSLETNNTGVDFSLTQPSETWPFDQDLVGMNSSSGDDWNFSLPWIADITSQYDLNFDSM